MLSVDECSGNVVSPITEKLHWLTIVHTCE